jgi:mRNA interferase HigB
MIVSDRGKIRDFYMLHAKYKSSCISFIELLENAKWTRPNDIAGTFPKCSLLKNNRACIDLGPKVRVIVRSNYLGGITQIRFIGLHKDYDRIDANTI